MSKGNGANKIASIYWDHEIPWHKARIGDMIINKETGAWGRIKEICGSNPKEIPDDVTYKTTHGYEISLNEVIVVRY